MADQDPGRGVVERLDGGVVDRRRRRRRRLDRRWCRWRRRADRRRSGPPVELRRTVAVTPDGEPRPRPRPGRQRPHRPRRPGRRRRRPRPRRERASAAAGGTSRRSASACSSWLRRSVMVGSQGRRDDGVTERARSRASASEVWLLTVPSAMPRAEAAWRDAQVLVVTQHDTARCRGGSTPSASITRRPVAGVVLMDEVAGQGLGRALVAPRPLAEPRRGRIHQHGPGVRPARRATSRTLGQAA